MYRIFLAITLCVCAVVQPAFSGEHPSRMPRLKGLILLHAENKEVVAEGRIIKWLDYALARDGPAFYRAVYIACNHVLQYPPFMIHNLFTDTLSIDYNGDGKPDEVLQSPASFDPVDFFFKLPKERKCESALVAEAAPRGAAILYSFGHKCRIASFRAITSLISNTFSFLISPASNFHHHIFCSLFRSPNLSSAWLVHFGYGVELGDYQIF